MCYYYDLKNFEDYQEILKDMTYFFLHLEKSAKLCFKAHHLTQKSWAEGDAKGDVYDDDKKKSVPFNKFRFSAT